MLPRSAQQRCSSPLTTSVAFSGLTLMDPHFPFAGSPKCCSSAPLQVGSHKSRVKGRNPLPCPAGLSSDHGWEAKLVPVLNLELCKPVSLLSTGMEGYRSGRPGPGGAKGLDPWVCLLSPLRMGSGFQDMHHG